MALPKLPHVPYETANNAEKAAVLEPGPLVVYDGRQANGGFGGIEANESVTNPNVNCLEGKRCPKCGSYGPFEIVVSTRVLLCDNGTDDAEDGSTWYDDDAPAMCCECRHEGKLGDFDE